MSNQASTIRDVIIRDIIIALLVAILAGVIVAIIAGEGRFAAHSAPPPGREFQINTAVPSTKTHIPLPSATIAPVSSTVNFAVSGTEGWQSTGVEVNQGEQIEIIYTDGTWAGRVGWGPSLPDIWADAGGTGYQIYYDEFGITSSFASLIGKIGDGPVIQVGRSYDSVSTQAGTLFLRMFDIDMSDNAGSINIQIIVWP